MTIPFKLWVLLAIVVLAPLVPYLLGPFLIFATMRQSAKPKTGSFPPDDPKLPKPVAKYFQKVRAALATLGFEVVEGLTLPEQTTNVKAVCLMLANRKDKAAALASAMYGEEPDGTYKLQLSYLEFVTRFRDGSTVQTNNSEEIGAFAGVAHVSTTQLPMVKEADRLYRLHQQLVKRHDQPVEATLRLDKEFKGDGGAYLRKAIVEELENQIDTGYLARTDDGDAFKPTLKGAFLMTWGLLWPFKAIRRSRRDAKARRLLAELETA